MDQGIGPYVNRLSVDRYIADTHRLQFMGRPIVDRCLVVTPLTYHRRSTDTPLTYHRLLSYTQSTPPSIAASFECLEAFHCRSVFIN